MSLIETIRFCLILAGGYLMGASVGDTFGTAKGAAMHYKGELVCETLLDKTVRCIPTSEVKEK